jgi:patatin-related protein
MPPQSALNNLTREVRLGIVLYGGVSLAVYENGVAQELFRAVKGAGIYTVVKQLTGCDVVLDIISGTSAGGINGILLAYALANNCDLSVAGDFWREEGDILNLLRTPREPAPNSILNSRGYYQPRLEKAYAAIKKEEYKALPEDLVSPIAELDVFITGTNVYGHVYTEFDDFGHPIDVKDHRALFHLRKRIENDFSHEAAVYAKLSRITSGFPVAFEPVEVSRNGDAADGFLIDWGKLEFDPAGKQTSAFFLDGGILNNKPFSSTLGAIFHHTQTREVERYLLYVEPDPEQFRKHAAGLQTAPNVVQAASGGLTSIPGYQSIAADLRSIAEHNSRVQRYRELAATLNQISGELMSDYIFPAPADLADLAHQAVQPAGGSGSTTGADQATRAEGKTREEQAEIYIRSRIGKVRDRVIDGILKQAGNRTLLEEAARRAAGEMVREFNQLTEVRVRRSLHEFDVYYRMRRLFFIADVLNVVVNQSKTLDDASIRSYREVWGRINNRIKRLEIIQSKMEELIDLADFHWQEIMTRAGDPAQGTIRIWASVQDLLRRLLDPAGLSSEAIAGDDESAQTKLYEALGQRVQNLVNALDPGSVDPAVEPDLPDNLLLRGDADELEILKQHTPGHLRDQVTQHYCRFVFVDSYLFPIQYTSEMECTDEVRTVRISPVDARLGFSGDPRKRLCGDELWHFGGFFKSSWRANDLMWGRLDGACQLIQCIVTRERLRKLTPPQQQLIIDSLKTRCPSAAEYISELAKQLDAFAGAFKDPVQEKNSFDRLLNALTYVAQAEILQQEMPKVIESSIAQQAAWNQYDRDFIMQMSQPGTAGATPRQPIKRRWRAGARQPDRAVISYAATRFSEESASRDWVKYFRESYNISAESWQNGIPKPVMVEILATMMLVLRKSLIAIGGERTAVARSRLFKMTTLPVWIAYYLTQLQRLAPEYRWNMIIGTAVLCISILAMDAYVRIGLRVPPNKLLWIVPIIVLLTLGALIWEMYRRYRPSGARIQVNPARLSKGASST